MSSSTFGSLPAPVPPSRFGALLGAASAASITIPHALGLGLIAFAPLAGRADVAALALWSAALPGALLTLVAPRRGVVYTPTTVVALLFATVMGHLGELAGQLQLGPGQVLAICGATVALGFAFQWLLGVLRIASLARFLPISVSHGFAAGVGLSMAVSQLRSGFGAGPGAGWSTLAQHAGAGLAVVALALLLQRRWPRFPGLLPAVALVALLVALAGSTLALQPAIPPGPFGWVPLPEWDSVPWLEVVQAQGLSLALLALLMAVVNSIDVVVFDQELELEHGERSDPDAALRRESLVGVLCALACLIPASTSASRSRVALQYGPASLQPGRIHAVLMLLVAASGHLWLPWVPIACLAGGLLLAGLNQVPRVMASRDYAAKAFTVWSQSWIVAIVFVATGGVGALVAGLVVATFVLLHSSASTALRRSLLDGQLRSRRLRRAGAEAWLASHMSAVAVFELQGVISFGVAAYLAEQVRAALLPRHRRVILDASRVAAWDATALARLAALVRDLGQQGVEVVACGLDAPSGESVASAVVQFADLDRALEWAEEDTLQEWPAGGAQDEAGVLGELGEGLSDAGGTRLVALLRREEVPARRQVFAAGDRGTALAVVQSGRITLSTHWPPATGLRLATVGRGMAFGEMAFLNGQARTACAGTEAGPAVLVHLARADFDRWAASHPADALCFMNNLAQIGVRRLAATTRQLRAVLE